MRHSKNYMENTKKCETLEENLASYTDGVTDKYYQWVSRETFHILNQYCATLDQIVKEYKEQSRFIANSLRDIIQFLKN